MAIQMREVNPKVVRQFGSATIRQYDNSSVRQFGSDLIVAKNVYLGVLDDREFESDIYFSWTKFPEPV